MVPVTTVDRGWPNHVLITGSTLTTPSWAMTEQVRTISRDRIVAEAGAVDHATLERIRRWIADFLDTP